jgi:hypothetical protein
MFIYTISDAIALGMIAIGVAILLIALVIDAIKNFYNKK